MLFIAILLGLIMGIISCQKAHAPQEAIALSEIASPELKSFPDTPILDAKLEPKNFYVLQDFVDIRIPKRSIREECEDIGFPTKYNKLIKAAWIKHAPAEWWDYYCGAVAQIYAESSGNAKAQSRKGASGLGQIIEAAANDCRGAGGMQGRRQDVVFSLNCMAYLMARSARFWAAERTDECRLELARASYISGAGNIHNAQRKAVEHGLAAICLQDGILKFLPQVIHSDNARDVEKYIHRINDLEHQLTQKESI